MRRFSQRNSLVTLNEINITPLLDLAFVLLIIFVITTPFIEQGVNLKLPTGGGPDQPLQKKDIQTIDITEQGSYRWHGQALTLNQIEREMVEIYRANPNLTVIIRTNGSTHSDNL